LLYETLSIEEPTQAPIPPKPKPIEPPRQGRSRGRGVFMYSKESLRESPRERSVSRIAWVRRLAEQQEKNLFYFIVPLASLCSRNVVLNDKYRMCLSSINLF
jgi:hypothetical protein